MSHRRDCPSPWEARRQGEDAYARGSGRWSNPYDERSRGAIPCREASREWEDGHRYAERQAEERAADERRAARRRQEEQWEREAMQADWERQEYDRAMEEEYNTAMEALQTEQYFWMEQDQLLDAADVS